MKRNTPDEAGAAERRRSRNSADKAAVSNLVLPLCIQCGKLQKETGTVKRREGECPKEKVSTREGIDGGEGGGEGEKGART